MADRISSFKVPPGLAKRGELPPGLAKMDKLPPGLVKKHPVDENQAPTLALTPVLDTLPENADMS